MTFNDIFKSSFLESVSEFSLLDTLIGLAAALVIGIFIFLIYKKRSPASCTPPALRSRSSASRW